MEKFATFPRQNVAKSSDGYNSWLLVQTDIENKMICNMDLCDIRLLHAIFIWTDLDCHAILWVDCS